MHWICRLTELGRICKLLDELPLGLLKTILVLLFVLTQQIGGVFLLIVLVVNNVVVLTADINKFSIPRRSSAFMLGS